MVEGLFTVYNASVDTSSVQTGKLWAQMGDHETAEACYARAMEYAHSLLSNTADATPDAQEYRATEVFSLYLDRTVVAWELQQQVCASSQVALLSVTNLAYRKMTRCMFGKATLYQLGFRVDLYS